MSAAVTIPIPNPVPWYFLLALVVVAKLVLLVLLARRLRQAFPIVWNDLGRPFSFDRYASSATASDSFGETKAQYSLLFFVFSGLHRDLQDRQVTALVWSARLTLVLLAVVLVMALSQGLPQPARYRF
jgi:asparagine N-glycosylation enzyme membrane subunit Stt3